MHADLRPVKELFVFRVSEGTSHVEGGALSLNVYNEAGDENGRQVLSAAMLWGIGVTYLKGCFRPSVI